MNLLIDATSAQSKRYAGIGTYTENLLKNMVQNSPRESSYVLYEGLPYSETMFDGAKRRGPVNIYKINKNFSKLSYLQSYALNSISSRLKSYKKALLYFSPYFLAGIPTNNVPKVITLHDLALKKFDYYSDRGGVVNLFRKYEYNNLMEQSLKAERIITHTQFTKDEYLAAFPTYPEQNIKVVPLGVELQEIEAASFEKCLPEDWRKRKYLLYLGGGIQKNKNSEGVITSYKIFIDQLISEGKKESELPYLVIAGKIFNNLTRPQSKTIRALVDQLKLNNKVIFSGFYSDDEKYSLLKNSFAFIHLSLYEGFGIAVAEAMRARVPVIADNHSTYPEVLGDSGLLVDGTDYNQCAQMIMQLYKDKKLSTSLGEMGRTRSMQFTWKGCAEKTYEVLERVYLELYAEGE